MRRTRSTASGWIAGASLLLAVGSAAVEPNRSQWPRGVDVPVVAIDGTRTFSLSAGDEVAFWPGVARPGDVVVCEEQGVITVGARGQIVTAPPSIEAISRPDGAVRVRCGA